MERQIREVKKPWSAEDCSFLVYSKGKETMDLGEMELQLLYKPSSRIPWLKRDKYKTT